ncbi:DUF3742 family protein [Pseudomonas gessardii]|uniref:DUF3742 family protein n=1 Tax=Pseudomonas gessardii TaxID=78544 RepID=A0A7Y1QMT7_9PSED|nr:DUF3742 family protein [Pseudomonas gessardii]NNA97455.1 DUF3742 family protein [Pseudomonas gessardii]OPK00810.1 hypothetical protein BZ164_30645 [Pseudomonas veronii]
MITQTPQGVASRFGYGLGRVARFVLHDRNPVLRWVKRLALAAAVLYFSSDIFSVLASVAVLLLVFGGAFWLLSNSESSSSNKKTIDYGSGYGPQGYGYYKAGRRVDDDD